MLSCLKSRQYSVTTFLNYFFFSLFQYARFHFSLPSYLFTAMRPLRFNITVFLSFNPRPFFFSLYYPGIFPTISLLPTPYLFLFSLSAAPISSTYFFILSVITYLFVKLLLLSICSYSVSFSASTIPSPFRLHSIYKLVNILPLSFSHFQNPFLKMPQFCFHTS